MVERHRGQRVDRVPGRVVRHRRVEVGGDEPEVRGRELPLAPGCASGVAPRLELLEVRELAHVDLRREVAADRLLERLVRARGSRPGSAHAPGERLLRALPEQHLQPAAAHLETTHVASAVDVLRADVVDSATGFRLSGENLGDGDVTAMRKGIGVLAARGRSRSGSPAAADDDERGRRRRPAPATAAAGATRQGRARHRRRPAQRPRLQPARVRGREARRERSSASTTRVLESASDADYVPNMPSLADEGYDLIIGVGFAQGEAVDTVAKRVPRHEVRDHRRRPVVARRASRRTSSACSSRRRRSATSPATSPR